MLVDEHAGDANVVAYDTDGQDQLIGIRRDGNSCQADLARGLEAPSDHVQRRRGEVRAPAVDPGSSAAGSAINVNRSEPTTRPTLPW